MVMVLILFLYVVFVLGSTFSLWLVRQLLMQRHVVTQSQPPPTSIQLLSSPPSISPFLYSLLPSLHSICACFTLHYHTPLHTPPPLSPPVSSSLLPYLFRLEARSRSGGPADRNLTPSGYRSSLCCGVYVVDVAHWHSHPRAGQTDGIRGVYTPCGASYLSPSCCHCAVNTVM